MANLCNLHNALLPLIVYLTVGIISVDGSVGEIQINLTIRLCSEDFCDLLKCVPFQECTGEVVKKGSVCGCCDTCANILSEGEECGDIVTPYGGQPMSKCKSELTCNEKESPPKCRKRETGDKVPNCLKDKVKRQKLLANYQGKTIDTIFSFEPNLWIPDCDEDGYYKPRQCKSNKCFCVNPEGARLFGQAERVLATNMTCGCSLAMYNKKIAEGDKWMTSFREHCTEMGNFAELQCTDGVCFCVDSITGHATSRVVKPSQKDLLSCYKSEDFEDDSYLTRCEQQVVRENSVSYTFARKGITIYRADGIICDLDGSFGPRQCVIQNCRCTDRNGESLDAFAMDTTGANPDTMNCRCARDLHDNDRQGAQYPKLKCKGNGNFAEDQYFANAPLWCSDEDGDMVARSETGLQITVTDLHNRCKAIIECLEKNPECERVPIVAPATTPTP